MTESEISSQIIRMLKTDYRAVAWKVWQGPLSKKGVSDILGCLPGGRMLAIEVKRPDGRYGLTKHQRAFLDAVAGIGGVAFVARSVDEVQARLAENGFEKPQQELF